MTPRRVTRDVRQRKERTAMKPKMIIPMLTCSDPLTEIEFCKNAFAAQELSRRESQGGAIAHATLLINNSLIMVHNVTEHLASQSPKVDGSSSVVIYLYGEEVDPVIEKARTAGARILIPAEDQFWGDRVGRIVDPCGHAWNIAARINDNDG
jgi:PhnB protein